MRFFDALGVPTYEVYGLSEIGSVVAMNRPGRKCYGSVGQPLDIVDVRLSPDGEVLAKSKAALENYWDELDQDLFDAEGYLRTGDLGEFRNGHLYIIGRKKEIIKTSTGQRISPVQVESVYKDIPGVDEIIVIGNGRKYLTALVAMNEGFRLPAEENGTLDKYLAAEFAKRSVKLAPTRQVKRFAVLSEPLSVVEGEITATMKLRRAAIEEKHKKIIDAMYQQSEA